MLRKVSADGKMPAKAILTAQKEKGAQSISVSTVEGWRVGEVQDFIIFTTDGEDVVPGSISSWTGVPAANGDIAELTLTGGMDILYPIGAVVMPTATSSWANELISALLVAHSPDGSLKSEAIPKQEIQDKSITADKIDFTTIPMFSATTSKWILLERTSDNNPKWNKVKYDTVDYNIGNMYDSNSFTVTIPKNGVYHIDARVGIASSGFFSGYTAYMGIFKNDKLVKESAHNRGTDNSLHLPRPSLSVDLLLKKNDVIDVRAFCDDQRDYGGEGAVSEFSMRLVGII